MISLKSDYDVDCPDIVHVEADCLDNVYVEAEIVWASIGLRINIS